MRSHQPRQPERPRPTARRFGVPALVGALLLASGLALGQDEAPREPTPVFRPVPVVTPAAPESGQINSGIGVGIYSEESPARAEQPAPRSDDRPEAERVQLDPRDPVFQGVRDKEAMPDRKDKKGAEEYFAQSYVLAHARKFPPEVLDKYARRNVPYGNLVGPIHADYQFKLIHVEGWLQRLRREEPNEKMAADGIADFYEAWVEVPRPPGSTDDPYLVCVGFTELPPGLKPVEQPQGKWVAFDGYYFKLLRYESGERLPDGKYKARIAPLLLGRTIQLAQPPEGDSPLSFRSTFVPLVLGLLGVILAVTLGLTLWFRRGDRRARAEITDVQTRNNPFEAGPAPPGGPPESWGRDEPPPTNP